MDFAAYLRCIREESRTCGFSEKDVAEATISDRGLIRKIQVYAI